MERALRLHCCGAWPAGWGSVVGAHACGCSISVSFDLVEGHPSARDEMLDRQAKLVTRMQLVSAQSSPASTCRFGANASDPHEKPPFTDRN